MIPNINLLRQVDRSEARPKLVYVIIGAAAVVVSFFLFWIAHQYQNDIDSLHYNQQLLQEQKAQLQAEYNQLTKQHTDTFAAAVELAEHMAYPVSPVLEEVSKLLPAQAQWFQYTLGGNAVTVKAGFNTISAISAYTDLLENSPYFNDVQPDRIDHFIAEYRLLINEHYLSARGKDIEQK